MDFENYFDQNNNNSAQVKNTEQDELLEKASEILKPTDDDFQDDFNDEQDESIENTVESKNRFARLNKLGAKGIIKAADLGAANLARKIALADSALPYRADKEALDDLTEVIEEIIPKRPGESLRIPVWLQLLMYVLIAFLPVFIAAFSDRRENKIAREEKEEIKRLKRERKILKQTVKNEQLKREIESHGIEENQEIPENESDKENEN